MDNWLVIVDRKNGNFRRKRKHRYINTDHRRFYVKESKSRASNRGSGHSIFNQTEGNPVTRTNPMSQGDSSFSTNHSRCQQQQQKENYPLRRERGNGPHFSVKDFNNILDQEFSTDTNVIEIKNPERTYLNKYQKIKSAISNVFSFSNQKTDSKAIQINQSEIFPYPNFSEETEPRIMSDTFIDFPKHLVNFTPRHIECDSNLMESKANKDRFNISGGNAQTNNKLRDDLSNKSSTIEDSQSYPSLGPIKERISHRDPYFINQAVGNEKSGDNSSDIFSDDEEILPNDHSEVNFPKNRYFSKSDSQSKASHCPSPWSQRGTRSPYSETGSLPVDSKNLSILLNNLLKCANEEQNSLSPVTTAGEFEDATSKRPATPKVKIGPKEQSKIEKQIKEIKQSSPDNTPIQALLEIFGTESHITGKINSALTRNQKLDPRFRSARTVDDDSTAVLDEIPEQLINLDVDEKESLPDQQFKEILNEYADAETNTDNNSTLTLSQEEHVPQKLKSDYFFQTQGNTKCPGKFSLDVDVDVDRNLLLNMKDRAVCIENHITNLKENLDVIKNDILKQLNYLEEREKMIELLHAENNQNERQLIYNIDCDRLYSSFSDLECCEKSKLTVMKLCSSSKIVIIALAFFIGFMSGDYIRK